jgi:hypothetical protein
MFSSETDEFHDSIPRAAVPPAETNRELARTQEDETREITDELRALTVRVLELTMRAESDRSARTA